MKVDKILILITGLMALTACNSKDPEIRAICLRDGIGNYIIKWETNPVLEGSLKYYVSDTPDSFNKSRPAGYANIQDNVTTFITSENMTRKYFMLTFNDKYPRIISSRSVMMNNIDNLRDLGGYVNRSDKTTQWGKIYRSGEIHDISAWDSVRLENLGIKTIIDLRTEEEVFREPIDYSKAKVVHIPVPMGNLKDITQRIMQQRVRKGDGILFMQDLYLQFMTENHELFGEAMQYFLDKDNYPILFNCTYGKDRAGFLAAMLLAALDVPEDLIIRDYVLSNDYINFRKMESFARTLNTNSQETITAMMLANESLMELVFRKIKRDYGSFEKYLSKELNMNDKKRAQLKDIMLY